MLDSLYSEIILDLYKSGKNCTCTDNCEHSTEAHNPLCGDSLKLEFNLKDNNLDSVAIECNGCAISVASAYFMKKEVENLSKEDAKVLAEKFVDNITSDTTNLKMKAEYAVFEGVKKFPARVKCATMCWHALLDLLKDKSETV